MPDIVDINILIKIYGHSYNYNKMQGLDTKHIKQKLKELRNQKLMINKITTTKPMANKLS